MITISIHIDLMHDNPDYSEYHKSENAVLTLNSVPERSEDRPGGATYYGEWMSTSIYIGKQLTGKYLIKRINYFDDPDYSPTVRDKRIKNPVGWFFDSRSSTSPFLTLYEFSPGVVASRRGFGMLDYEPLTIWSGVDWALAGVGK